MSDRSFKVAVMLSAYDKMSTVVNSAVDKTQRKLKGLEKTQKNLNSFGNAAMIGGGIATAYFATSIKAAEESLVAENRLIQVYRNRGEQTDVAAKKALAYAGALQLKIGVEDEEIAAIQAKIAVNKSIGDKADMFNRATKASFDIAAAGYGDASMNAAKLGKMLEHPIEGINAFSKAGIIFNKSEKEKIKNLVNSGYKIQAQEFLMAKLEKKFHDVAEKSAPASTKIAIAWGEVSEQIGKVLLPYVEKFASYLINTLIPKVQAFIEKNSTLIKAIAAGGVAFLGLGGAAKVISFGMSGLGPVLKGVGFAFKFLGNTIGVITRIFMANPILLGVAAIAGIVYLIYNNWGGIKKWFGKMWDSVVKVFSATWQWLKKMFLNYTPYGLVIKHWDKISAWFTGLWEKVKNIFSSVWEWVKGLFVKYHPIGIVYKHWDEIVEYFTGIWEKVKNVFKNAWKAIKNGIKSFFGAGDADAIANTYAKSLNAVNRTAAKGIAITAGGVNVSNGMGGSGSMGLRPVPVNNNASHYNYAPNIILNGSATPQDAQAFMNYTKKDIIKTMKEENDRKARTGY